MGHEKRRVFAQGAAAGGGRGLSPGQDLHPLRGLPTPPGGGGLPPGQEAGGPAQRGGEHHLLVRRHRRLPGRGRMDTRQFEQRGLVAQTAFALSAAIFSERGVPVGAFDAFRS